MAKLLLLFAHPALEKLKVRPTLLKRVRQIAAITINHLCQHYPFPDIKIHRVQELLLSYDIFHGTHPVQQPNINIETGRYAVVFSAVCDGKITNPRTINYLNELLPIIQSKKLWIKFL